MTSWRPIVVGLLLACPAWSSAQSAALPAYQSAFKTYRVFKDEPVGVWREVNDATAKAGGWRVYAREQSQSASSASAPPHAGHGAAK